MEMGYTLTCQLFNPNLYPVDSYFRGPRVRSCCLFTRVATVKPYREVTYQNLQSPLSEMGQADHKYPEPSICSIHDQRTPSFMNKTRNGISDKGINMRFLKDVRLDIAYTSARQLYVYVRSWCISISLEYYHPTGIGIRKEVLYSSKEHFQVRLVSFLLYTTVLLRILAPPPMDTAVKVCSHVMLIQRKDIIILNI